MLFTNTKMRKRGQRGEKIPAKKYSPPPSREVKYPHPTWLRSYTPIYFSMYPYYPWWG